MERVSIRAAWVLCVYSARRAWHPSPLWAALAFLISTGGVAAGAAAQTSPPAPPRPPVVDPNVNMVRGIAGMKDGRFTGDPYLQRQNEPSIAVSTRNACHLLAGANDYRLVDQVSLEGTPLPNTGPSAVADAWLGLFKSSDCGQKWQSTLVPGYPGDLTGEGAALQGFEAGADPTVRAGSNGLFYYSGIVFNRGVDQPSRLFVARYQDFNNKERGDTIQLLGITGVADGKGGQFVDKPWMAVDLPRPGLSGTCEVPADPANSVAAQRFQTGYVYLAWTRFDGDGDYNPSKVMFARSTDCGRTFKASPISSNQQTSQGAMIAIAPDDGTVYVAWREFGRDGKPAAIHFMRSRDGGQRWEKLKPAVPSFMPFDQGKSATTFRTTALPSIAAAPGGLVYVAVAARGYHKDADGQVLSDDSRIVLAVSSDAGENFAEPYAIDNDPAGRGHQIMPALAYGAGMLQATYYDFRGDFAGHFGSYVDEGDNGNGRRHTVDVRGAWAEAGPRPVFRGQLDGSTSDLVSQFATSALLGQVRWNPVNLPLYGQGVLPFLGDYIDTTALTGFPVRSANGQDQQWLPNDGVANVAGAAAQGASAYASLPVFHATWTDNRDVKSPPAGTTWADYTAPGWSSSGECDPNLAGIRDANIYTSRITPGLYVGSPGNTKPLGKVINPKTGQEELIQRGFAVFAQNTTSEVKRFRLTIANQPSGEGGRASFRQFDINRRTGEDRGALSTLEAVVPRRSTVARTVYVKAEELHAQVLVNVEELELCPKPIPSPSAPAAPWTCPTKPGGPNASVLLNPDLTNPRILDPDFVSDDVPGIAEMEVHDVGILPPIFLRRAGKSSSLAIAVPWNPDIENPDIENPDIENPDIENPDIENPDIENPDIENPDIENPDIENTAIAAIGDVQWTVSNEGNTTSAYRFRPTLKRIPQGLLFQLIVTKRYLMPTVNEATCKPRFRVENQVVVNIPGYTPRTPDIENPDIENPDIENPDIENPDIENPDIENVTFLLAPEESATVTLRLIKPRPASELEAAPADASGPLDPDIEAVARELLQFDEEIDFSPRQETGATVIPQAADTGEPAPVGASAGPDLVVSEPMPTLSAPGVVPPGQITFTFTIRNKGTSPATAYVDGIPGNPTTTIKTRFYLSTDIALSTDDVYLGIYEHTGTIGVCTELDETSCIVTHSQTLSIPKATAPGAHYVFAIVDDDNDADDGAPNPVVDNEVFEADDYNNRASAGPLTVGYQLAFGTQPIDTTQDLYLTPAVTVSVWYGDGTLVTDPLLVPQVSVSIGNNPAGGTLGGTLTQPNVAGMATFGNLSINNPSATPYTLAATAINSFGATSTAFLIETDLPPAVANDAYTVFEDQTLTVPTWEGGLLSNDRDPPFKGTKQPERNPRPSPGCPDGWCIEALPGTDPAQGLLTRSPDRDGSFTYIPPSQFNGVVAFTYLANDGRPGTSTAGTATITVVGINDVPSFAKGADQLVDEDSGARTVSGWATGISPGPANEAGQTVDFLVSADNPALFSVQPAISATGTLTFTPAAAANGTSNVTVRIHDSGGTDNGGVDTSAPQTFIVTVAAINDAPSFTKGANQTVGEDAGAQTVSGWATGIAAGPPNEAGQIVDFIVSADVPALFSALPAISAAGTLTYTPAPNVVGTATVTVRIHDDGGTANGGFDTSAPQTFTITIAPINDTPTFTKGADQTVNEDGGAQTVANWATAISKGPADESGQTVDFLASADNAALFSAQPAISATGTLTYTPAPNMNGTATVTVRIHDSGGTAGGGNDTSAPQTFTITIAVVNDAPSFTKGTNQLVNEDPGPQTVPAWATSISAGTNEGTQAVDFLLSADNLALFSVQPAITPTGTLTYAPAANLNGTATVTVRLHDNGGTANGGLDASAPQTFTITITAVNDAPSFTKGANQLVNEDPGPQTVPAWATNISAGTNEGTQAVDFLLSADNPALFSAQPAITPTGTLTYTPAANLNGTATVTVRLHDNGGTANGGLDTSAPQTFTIAIAGVNDPPVALNDAAATLEDAAVVVSVLANDSDPDGNPLTVTGATVTSGGGAVVVHLNNTVAYTPAANFFGTATFSYSVSDGLGGAASATVTVTVTPVNDSPDAVGDAFTVAEDSGATTLNVRANDTSAPDSGETLTVTAVTQPASGTVTIATGGTGVIYTPPANYNGATSFTYTISDGNGGSDTASVSLTITAVNDAPVAMADSYVASDNDPLGVSAPGVLANDTDIEGSALTAVLAKTPLHGTLTFNDNGSFTYTPNGGFTGADFFRYQARDGSLLSAAVDVTITVEANELPSASPDTATTAEDVSVEIPVLANDIDFDGDTLTVSAVTPPQHGSATITGGGTTVTYQPALNWSGDDSFTYTVVDGFGGSGTASVSVGVTAVNDAPLAVNDVAVAIAGTTVPIDVLANDTDVESRLGLSVVSAASFNPPGLPYNVGSASEMAVAPAAGRLYVSAGRAILVYHLATNALDSLIPLPGLGSAQLHRLDAAAGILYFRHGMAIAAVDVRPGSPTFNQILRTTTFGGGINSFAVDEVRHRLYAVHAINAGGAPSMRQLDVVDGDPTSPTFLSITASVPMPGTPIGVAVNSVTNKVYVANANGNSSLRGLWVIDGATLEATQITLADGTTGAPPCYDVVVDPSQNMVYGLGTASPDGVIVAVDGGTNAVTSIPVASFLPVNWAGKMLAINTVSHRLYAWSGDFATPGKLVVVDASRSSGTFNTVIAQIPTQRDYCDVVVDETNNRVITTGDMGAIVINGVTNTVAGIVPAKQLTCDIAVNPAAGRAYVASGMTGFEVVGTGGTPARLATIITTSEAGSMAVDATRHVAFATKTVGTSQVVTLDRTGAAASVTGLPTDAGRYLMPAHNRLTGKTYVLNYGAGLAGGLPLPAFVTVIDNATRSVVKNVEVGDQPFGIGINEATNRVYVLNYGATPSSISVIDGATDIVVATVAAPTLQSGVIRFMRDVAANTRTNKIYVRSSSPIGYATLWSLDGASNALAPIVLPGTSAVAILRVNSEKNRIYAGMSDGRLFVLNGDTHAIVADLMVGYPSTAVGNQSYIAINEATDQLFVANFNEDDVTVLDYDGAVLGNVDVGDGPTAVAVNEETNTVYVTSAYDKLLVALDGATLTLRAGVSLPFQANFIAVDPGDRRIYAGSGSQQDVGLMVIADDPPTGNLTVSGVTPGALGSTQIALGRFVLYGPAVGTSGVDTFTYTASDGQATSNAATVTVTVAPALQIVTTSLPNGRSGTPYNETIQATGGTGARTWLVASGGLPSGTMLDGATGTLSGMPNTPGRYIFAVRVQDSAPVPQVATMTLTVGVGPLVITTGSLASGWVGTPYSATLIAAPITGTAAWSVAGGSLPAGFTLSADGVLSGTPDFYGTSSFTVRVTDDSGDVAERSLSLLVDAPLQIITPPRVALINQSYSTQSVGGRGTRNWTVSGDLPSGMTLSATTGLTGTPRETGHFPITLSLTDCYNNSCPTGTAPQTDTKSVTLHAAATDQSIGWNTSAMVQFGATGYSRIAQVFTAAMTGELVSVQPAGGMTCSWPTAVTAEIRRLTDTPPFAPDDSPGGLYASGTITMSSSTQIPLDTPVFFPIGTKFAIVLTASRACSLPTNTGSDYLPGMPFVFDGTWQVPSDIVDLGLTTHIVPPPGLVYTTTGRYGAVATPLLDGRILVTSNSTTAEVYDQASGTTTATANTLQVSRSQHAAVLLTCPSGTGCGYHGKVLVAGGEFYDSALGRTVTSNTAELYDPATNQFTVLAGTLAVGRSQFTMTRLPNGTVLVAGGQTRDESGNWSNISSAEIFDPGAMSFTQIGDMVVMRRQHTATLMSCDGCAGDGKVLLVGGWTWWNGPGPTPTAELFNPADSTFQPTTGATMDGLMRAGHTATPLADGRVVIAGGIGWWPDLTSTIEVYDPAADTFTSAGTIAVRRMNHAAVALDDGRVLIAGGTDRWVGSGLWLTSAEIYDPQTQLSTPTRNLIVPRSQAGSGRLACPPATPGCPYEGDVFLVGGSSSTQVASRSVEVVDPHAAVPALVITTTTLPNGQTGQPYPEASITATGGTPPYTFTVATGSLPPAVVLETTGAIHSLDGTTLTTAGAYQFVAKVQDSLSAVAYQSLSIVVNALAITTSSLPSGVIDQPYDAVLEAAGTPPYTWSLDTSIGGPPGLIIQADGHVTGTPTRTGCWTLGARVRDGSFQTVSKAISDLCINEPIDITSPAGLSDAMLRQWYDFWLNTNSNSGSLQPTWALALQAGEHFPRGLEVSSDGRIRGNALETGVFTFTVQVAAPSSPPQTDQQTFTLRVGAQDQSINGDGASMTPFGTSGHQRVAQIVTAGATGELMAVRTRTVECPADTSVTAEIRRLTGTPPFVPDDSSGGLLATQTVTPNSTFSFATPIFFPVGTRFAVVLSANGACQVRVHASEHQYLTGDPFVFDGASWQRPEDFQQLGLDTYVFPQGLTYTNGWRNQTVLTPLLDGRILVTSDSQDAEVYDPATGAFTPVANTLQVSRSNHAAVLLRCPSGDGCGYHGKVLVAGGEWWEQDGNLTWSSAELYDPVANQFTPLASELTQARSRFTMTRLADGKVLVAGGQIPDGSGNWSATRSAEIFDPALMAFTPIADMVMERQQHTATLISCGGCPADGKVLIVGGWTGWGGTTAELFEPVLGTFRATSGGTTDGYQRAGHTATALPNGNVVIAGGVGWWPDLGDLIEVYDHTTDSFTPAGNIAIRRMNPAAVALADGRVLLAGGWEAWFGPSIGQASVEIYDPQSQLSIPTVNLNVLRGNPAAVRVGDDVLVVGGGGGSGLSAASAEIVDVVAGSTALAIATTSLPSGQTGQPYAGATLAAAGGSLPYTFSLASGSLPPTLVLESNGAIHSLDGTTLTTAGAYQFIVRVTDGLGGQAFRNLQIRIDALAISTSPVAPGIVNQPYEWTLSAIGTAPFIWSLDSSYGWIPDGLTITADGRLSGTITQTGCWNIGVRVRDASFQTATTTLSICINDPLQINVPAAPFEQEVMGWLDTWMSASGGAQRTWSLALRPGDHLPLGLELTPDGHLFGTPREAGVFTVTVQAVDNTSVPPQSATGQITLRTGVADQVQWQINEPPLMLPVNSTHTVAQVVRTGVAGRLLQVQLPVACDSGDLTIEIQGVDSAGAPDGAVRATVVVPAAQIPPFETSAHNRWIPTPSPSLALNEYFAIVLRSNGACAIAQTSEVEYRWWAYQHGDAFTGDGTAWTSLGSTSRPALPFRTIMDPEGRLAFAYNWRSQHVATTLNDGKILFTGGTGNGQPTAIVYDPATGDYTPTTGEMIVPRNLHTATMLPDGRVLITGGGDCSQANCPAMPAVEVYDPSTDIFSPLADLLTARTDHTATLLPDGRILIAGGITGWGQGQSMLDGTEIYQVGAGSVAGPTLARPRNGHTATTLADGRVVIIGGEPGGSGGPTAEIYTPGTPGTMAPAGPMNVGRREHTATTLPDGRILIVGGWASTQVGAAPVAELYDPATDTFTLASGPLQTRQRHTATLLEDGKVLIAGGYSVAGDAVARLELYDPAAGQFSTSGAMASGRSWHTATRLADGRVLIAFGSSSSNATGVSSEIYDPASPPPSGPIAVQTTDPPIAYAERAYEVQLTAAGTGPFTWSLAPGSQPLPAGLSLTSDGRITGTAEAPTGWNVYSFTVRVVDAAGHSTTQSLSLIVEMPLEVATTDLGTSWLGWYDRYLGTQGAARPPFTWSVVGGTMPNGLSLDANGGHLLGYVGETGTFSFTVQVTDSSSPPQTDVQALALRVGANDQGSCCWQQPPVYLPIDGGQLVAQVITAGVSGQLIGVQMPVACEAGNSLTVGIYPVTQGQPDYRQAARLAEWTMPAGSVPQPDPNWLGETLLSPPTPVLVPRDGRFAVVLTSSGNCSIAQVQDWENHEPYTWGQGFTSDGITWTPLPSASPNRRDLSFSTMVLPSGPFAYIPDGGRMWHTATPLGGGKVLIAGISPRGAVYDEATGFFTRTTGEMPDARANHTATPLGGDGSHVLIAGGRDSGQGDWPTLWSALLYHPASGTFSTVGSLGVARSHHSATRLTDGTVLIAGGTNPSTGSLPSTELFDAVSQTFSTGPEMAGSRHDHTATLLGDGRVLVVGGWGGYSRTAEIYEPGVGFVASSGDLAAPRVYHTATRLNDGTVLIAGGIHPHTRVMIPFAEIFDPADNSFRIAGYLQLPRIEHAATLLSDGRVLLAGGRYAEGGLAEAGTEIFNPADGTFTLSADMRTTRLSFTATTLADGTVLLAGANGRSWIGPNSAEIFDPTVGTSLLITTASLPDAVLNEAYSATIVAPGAVTWSVVFGALPPGILLNGASGAVTGSPTVTGVFEVVVDVADGSMPANHVTRAFTIQVGSTLDLQIGALPGGFVGQMYLHQLTAVGGSGPRTWSIAGGSLPPGLALSNTGLVTGTPVQAGTFPFDVSVSDATGHSDTTFFAVTILAGADEATAWTTTFPSGANVGPTGLAVDQNDPDVVLATPTWRGIYKRESGGGWGNLTDQVEQLPFDRTGIQAVTIGPDGSWYLVASGVIFRSRDRGASWTQLWNVAAGWVRYVLPISTDTIFAAGESTQITKTTDGGRMWGPAMSGLSGRVISLAANPDGTALYAGTEGAGIYKSTDNGANWIQMTGTTGMNRVASVCLDPGDPLVMYAAVEDFGGPPAFVKSVDGGASWAALPISVSFVGGEFRPLLAIDVDGTLYGLSGSSVLVSADGGQTWVEKAMQRFGAPISSPVSGIVVADGSTAYVGTYGQGIYATHDGGVTFAYESEGMLANSSPHSSAHTVHVDSTDSNYVYAGTSGGAYRSTDGGATWSPMPLPDGYVIAFVSGPGYVYALAGDLYVSTDHGASWSLPGGAASSVCCGNGDLAVYPGVPSHTVYRAVIRSWNNNDPQNGVYKSTDGGLTWSSAGLSGLIVRALTVHPTDGSVYAGVRTDAGQQSGIYKTTDGGLNWTRLGGGLPDNLNPDQIILHPLDFDVVLVGSETWNGGVYRSDDAGVTWTQVLWENVNSIAIHPTDPAVVYAATWSSGGFYRSPDNGQTWVPMNQGLPVRPGLESISIDPSVAGRMFLGTAGGVYVRKF